MTLFRKCSSLAITAATGLLALAAFYLATKVREPGAFLLALVTLGTFVDFLGSYTGAFITRQPTLLLFTRVRFSLLNFGIVFTPMSAAFILSRTSHAPLCAGLANFWPWLAVVSLATGALFFRAKYIAASQDGTATYRLDRSDPFTGRAFVIRRVVLALSLLVAVAAVIDGVQSAMTAWTVLFGVLFIATVPLHILHWHVSSMAAEAATLAVLFYGAVEAFAR